MPFVAAMTPSTAPQRHARQRLNCANLHARDAPKPCWKPHSVTLAQRPNFSPVSEGGAPTTRKVKWSASCQATLPASAPSLLPWAARVRTPSARVDVPAIAVGGLPGLEASQLNLPSSLITRAIFPSLTGAAVQLPASFPSKAGAPLVAGSVAGGGAAPPAGNT